MESIDVTQGMHCQYRCFGGMPLELADQLFDRLTEAFSVLQCKQS
jgi:hypothetical protein